MMTDQPNMLFLSNTLFRCTIAGVAALSFLLSYFSCFVLMKLLLLFCIDAATCDIVETIHGLCLLLNVTTPGNHCCKKGWSLNKDII